MRVRCYVVALTATIASACTVQDDLVHGYKLLSPGQEESYRQGIYLYLLLGGVAPQRSLESIKAARALPGVGGAVSLRAHQLNPIHLLTIQALAPSTTDQAVLDSYDFVRARRLISRFGGEYERSGPYLLALPEPLAGGSSPPRPYLWLDFGSIPVEALASCLGEFKSHSLERPLGSFTEIQAWMTSLRRAMAGCWSDGADAVRIELRDGAS